MEYNEQLNTVSTQEQLYNMILAGAFFGSGGGGSIAGGIRPHEGYFIFSKKYTNHCS